ncbi:MAG TPA: hypothetical protein VM009_03540 [Terriglobales bacterium]|nr:hypothetical protein [Terriglobales bacterium]
MAENPKKKKAKKKKPKRFRAVTAVKAMAREAVGPVPPTRLDPDTKKKEQSKRVKHKPTLARMLNQEE